MSGKPVYLLCICLVLALVGSASADLVGHWPFDDGVGSTVVDVTGSGSDGAINGAPQWIAGYNGGALELGGGGDHVVIPNSEALKLRSADGFTVAVWIKVQDLGGASSSIMVWAARLGPVGFWAWGDPNRMHPGRTVTWCLGCVPLAAAPIPVSRRLL